jgi:VWFA-related protein
MSKKKIIHLTLVLSALLTLTGFSPKGQAEETVIRVTQIDTSDFPRVTVYVAITDGSGQPLGLDPARIRLLENGQEIPLDQIEGAGQIDPLTTLLVMDVSESMLYVGKLEAAKSAAAVFIDQLRPSDRIGLLTFNNHIKYVQPITEDRQLILSAINNLEAEEETALYDALSEAISILSEIEGRKAIVALTDGLDNLSQATPESVIEQIGPAGLSISTIGLGDPDQVFGDITRLDEPKLSYLAEKAGGSYGYANDLESLSELYQTYAIAFKSEYQLSYTSPSALRDGVNRALSVTLSDASPATGEDQEAITYNPGGLVPEVSQPVPWSTFGVILAGLVLLLLIPGATKLISKSAQKELPQGKEAKKEKPRIKLKD